MSKRQPGSRALASQTWAEHFWPGRSEVGWTLAAVIITIIGILLRAAYLNQPAGNDEAYTWLAYSSQSFIKIITDYSQPNNHIFHSLLAALSGALFGPQLWAIRFPAFLAGVGMLPVMYLTARKMGGPLSGLLATTFLAVSPLFLTFSAEARGYTLVSLFSLIMVWLGLYLAKHQSMRLWVLFSACGILGAYTIPIMLYPLAAIYVWLFLETVAENGINRSVMKSTAPVLMSAVVVVIGALLVYSPVIFAGSGWRSIIANGVTTPEPWAKFMENFYARLGRTWSEWNQDVPLILIGVMAIGFLFSFIPSKGPVNNKVQLAIAAVIGIIPIVLIQRVAPWPRIWQFMQGWYFLWAGVGLGRFLNQLLNTKMKLVGYALLLMLVLYPIVDRGLTTVKVDLPEYSTPGVEESLAIRLNTILQPGDQIAAVTPMSTQIKFYFRAYGDYKQWFHDTASPVPFERLIVVVGTKYDESLESVLAKNKLTDAVDLSSARLLETYKHAELYTLSSK